MYIWRNECKHGHVCIMHVLLVHNMTLYDILCMFVRGPLYVVPDSVWHCMKCLVTVSTVCMSVTWINICGTECDWIKANGTNGCKSDSV